MINRGKSVAGVLVAASLAAASIFATATGAQADSSTFGDQLAQVKTAAASDALNGQPSAADTRLADKLPKPGQVSTRSLVSDPDYWVFDEEYDSITDSFAYPELGSSAMAVSKAAPDRLSIVGLGSPYSDGTLTQSGYLGVLLDTDGDGQSDYGTVTPTVYMGLSSAYSSNIYRLIGGTTFNTGLTATWVRTSGGWVVSLPWQTMGITGARYMMTLVDGYGDRDWSPNTYGTYAQLAGVVGYVPPAPPAPIAQSVAGSVPASAKAKRNKKVSLPARTNAGTKLRWASQTPKVCKIAKNGKLVLTGKKGKCKITATAAGSDTRLALTRKYTVKLK